MKKVIKKFGYLAKNEHICTMKTNLTYQDLLMEIAFLQSDILRKKERIGYLERMLYEPKRDNKSKYQYGDNEPGLFDEEFNEACEKKNADIENTAKEIETEAKKRRKKASTTPSCPNKYRDHGLEERVRIIFPDGINLEDYEIIGKDENRIVHRQLAKLWVEVIERPILRLKSDKNSPFPKICQAPAIVPVIGGNHIGADFLSQLVIDKFVYHIPEYRQVKQYADLGVTLPTSTLNDWIHAVANKLYPLYESHCEDIRSKGIFK